MKYFTSLLLLLPLARAAPPQLAKTAVHGHINADDTGAPLRGVKVTLIQQEFARKTVAMTTTDETGVFEFTGLSPGYYSVYFEKPGFVRDQVFDALANEITVHLRRTGSISGRVLDRDGEPLEKVLVEVMAKSYMYGDVSLHSKGFTRTDDQGMYRVAGLAPGRYYVRASGAGYDSSLYPGASDLTGAQIIEIASGDARAEVDFRLRAGPRFSASGRLLDSDGRPAAASFLRAYSADLVAGTSVDGTIHEGCFELAGIRTGRYFLKFSWVGATNNVTRTAVFQFEMGTADHTGVILNVAPQATVSGRVRVNGGTIPGVSIVLQSADPALLANGGNAASGSVASDGTFEITGVEGGKYRIGVHSPSPPKFYMLEQSPITVAGDPVTGVEVALDYSAGTVCGRAVDRAGRPVAQAEVVLQSTDPSKRTVDLYRHVHRISTGGEYSISGIIPGEYLLFLWRGDTDLIGDPELFEEARKRAQRVTVTPSGTVRLDATEVVMGH